MKIIHTSDWHLGHILHGVSREYEHKKFLDWLIDILEEKKIDALIVSGDIFDSANPSASSQKMLYSTIAKAKKRCPHLQIILIGGNHDSAVRLDAPQPIMEEMGVSVVGGLPKDDQGKIDTERLIIPLKNKEEEIAGWCVAVPFLKQFDLPRINDEETDSLIEGVRSVYNEILEKTRQKTSENHIIILTGHCYMTGTSLSDLSERKILGGGQHALPVDIFPDDVSYVALGHLHLAQKVGEKDNIRYSGSPIPLSLSENKYPHQIVLIDFNEEKTVTESILVPRFVDILRIPEGDPQRLENVLDLLSQIKDKEKDKDKDEKSYPYLEVSVLLDEPQPGLRREIEKALSDKAVHLLKLTCQYQGSHNSLADSIKEIYLDELSPDQVFVQCYHRFHEGVPSKELMESFYELIEQIEI